jgi:hypothetical protein
MSRIDDGYRSPKSNVPNAPVRFAGVAPTTVTKGQLSDQVGMRLQTTSGTRLKDL